MAYGVLACREVDQDRIADAAALLRGRLPLDESALGALFVSAGLVDEAPTMAEVVRWFELARRPPPFRVVRGGRSRLVVSPDMARVAPAVAAATWHMLREWGVVDVATVVDRVRAHDHLSSPSPSRSDLVRADTVRAVIGALPGLAWLDGAERTWFTVPDHPSRLQRTLRTIFSVAARASVRDLRVGLAKSSPAIPQLPLPALRRTLALTGHEVDEDDLVRRVIPIGRRSLTRVEMTLARLLDAAGRVLDAHTLRQRALAASLARRTVNRALEVSPLFLPHDADAVRLVGEGRSAAFA